MITNFTFYIFIFYFFSSSKTFSIYNVILVLACIILAFAFFLLVSSNLITYVCFNDSVFFYFLFHTDTTVLAYQPSLGQSLFSAFTELFYYCTKELQILPTIPEVPIKGNPLDIDNIFGLQ